MVFKQRTDFINFQAIHIRNTGDRMGISHGQCRDPVLFFSHLDGIIHHPAFSRFHGDFFRLQLRRTHIDPHPGHFAVFHSQLQSFHPAAGVNRNCCFISQAIIIDIFCHTADTVSAHGAPGSIRIVHLHFKVRGIGWFDQNQPVGADAEMPVADLHRHLLRVFYFFLKTVDIDVIVADSLHFRKFHLKFLSSGYARSQLFSLLLNYSVSFILCKFFFFSARVSMQQI